jgi:LacI family transcriptional regulator
LAARHLIERGCQKIGLITGPLNWWEARQRELGWREEMVAHGRIIDESCIAQGDWSSASGERCMRMLLEWHADMDGVFTCNDQMALGAMKAARALAYDIPQNLLLVGFDDIPESAYFYPSLTTVRQDMAEIGATAVNQLIHLLEHTEENGRPAAFLLTPELIVRESTQQEDEQT